MRRRLFVGIPLPDNIRKVCSSLSDHFSRGKIRWIQPENLHITLFFIGQVEEEQRPELTDELTSISSSLSGFQLKLDRFTYKPTKRPRMIWAQFADSAEFTSLASTINDRVGHLRKDEEQKEPLPHATIARFKYLAPKDRATLRSAPPLAMAIDGFNLYESHLSSEGSRYEVIEAFTLRVAQK